MDKDQIKDPWVEMSGNEENRETDNVLLYFNYQRLLLTR